MNDRTIVSCTISPPEGRATVRAVFSDGESGDLLSFFTDEIYFTPQEFVGLTEKQARRLHYDRDLAYLRSEK